ncbi:MAG TPA: hypothetical protein VM536_21175 [Chloroflexia bacterium]|nr:hypothetical protein [Chloroflexia bacterium]
MLPIGPGYGAAMWSLVSDRSFRGGTFKSVDEANKVLDALIFDYWHQTTTITIQRQGQELTLPIAPMVYKWNIPLTPLPKELRHF